MKLEKIKLSGFKSFVDTTVIPITGNLTAIVGPNGCGKSNIIDAVRWVMGESSAKHLRGGSMADVIFNGSSGRKPVSTASVELIFNNAEGKLGGEYAQYGSIAIKRQVSRDGQSLFMLNGSRCRRKDITDLFLGTGLGSRSYAIIEQGTISRMVEAKPDELRIHIEEAAGISKYKERRQETETRMKHTRENLERLDDLREEVDKQLKHLQKQAEKAEKYTGLKRQERQFKLELLAMRWDSYHQAAGQLESKLHEVAAEHNRLFVLLREIDGAIESKRAEHKTQQLQASNVQGDYYAAAAEVSRLEQAIKHSQSSHEQTTQEINRIHLQISALDQEIATDLQTLEDDKEALLVAEEERVLAEEKLDTLLDAQQEAQQQQHIWQQQWDVYRTESAQYKEQAEVLRVKAAQLDNQNRQLQQRIDKLDSERGELSATDMESEIVLLEESVEVLDDRRSGLHDQLEQRQHNIHALREQVKSYHGQLHIHRSELHSVKGTITSLELLQQHAMGKDNKNLGAWLASVNMDENKRLAEFLDVQAGWDIAVETVLASYLEAICVDHTGQVVADLARLTDESLTLFATATAAKPELAVHEYDGPVSGKLTRLLDKITAPWQLKNLLGWVYCADDHATACALSEQLKAHESVITPDGAWFGQGWLKISRSKDSKTGVLQREKELRLLKQRQDELQLHCAALEEQLERTDTGLKETESERDSLQQQYNVLGSELSAKKAALGALLAKQEQQQRRLQQVGQDLADIREERTENAEIIAELHLLQNDAGQQLGQAEEKRQSLEALNQRLQAQRQQTDQAVNGARQHVYSVKAKIDNLLASEKSVGKQLERLHSQRQHAVVRIAELEIKQQQTLMPLDEEKRQLEQGFIKKSQLEAQLKIQRRLQDEIEAAITQSAEQQTRVQRDLDKQKEALDQLRFQLQESQVRQQTVNEQLKEIDADVGTVLKNLPAQAEEDGWKRKVDDLAQQIERLGTINLSAIEEYQAQGERLKFLDEQHADLIEALQTLDHAISKIDKESRLRFKETFDKINSGLQEKFPKLFGGGQAYLELTNDCKDAYPLGHKGGRAKPPLKGGLGTGAVAEQDLLESGVTIIARPPGKRNSSIHLLSGGEKALTAVALVFSIFELNPAPFCLLDEVDAPLDDANVGRFSKMVEEMSASVQFLYISHNKVTMEIAHQLAGVTMKEPGVSRMVAVDIEEAVSLAES